TVATLSDGTWSALVPPGTTTADIDESDPQYPGLLLRTEGDDPTTVLAIAAATVSAGNDGFVEPGVVTGHVFHDVNGDGAQSPGEGNIAGAEVIITTAGSDTLVATTGSNGTYAAFVRPGSTTLDVDESTLPAGTTLTSGNDPQDIIVTSGESIDSASVGYQLPVLAISKTANTPGPVTPGSPVSYTVTVSNNSGTSHTGVSVRDIITNGEINYAAGINVSGAPATVGDTPVIVAFHDLTAGGTSPSGGTGWAGDWTEIKESDGFNRGDIRISAAGLRIRRDEEGAYRVIDLTGFTGASLQFDYKRKEFEEDEYISVGYTTDLPVNGSSNWVELEKVGNELPSEGLIPAAAGDSETASSPEFALPVTGQPVAIRFFTVNDDHDPSDLLEIKSLSVSATSSAPQPGTAGTAAPFLATNYSLDDGDMITITYEAAVDSGTGFTSIDNTASVTSDQQGAPEAASVSIAVEPPTTGTITGHLFIDTNGNGLQDAGEPDLADVDVLVSDSTQFEQTVTTDSSGYWIATVPGGTTTADVDESDPDFPAGYTQTVGTDPTGVTAVAGSSVDAGTDGYYLAATLTGLVYIDTNGNGTRDGGEPGLAGVDLTVSDSENNTQTVTTNSDGTWLASVPPGPATADIDENDPDYPAGYTRTEGDDPSNVEAVAGASTPAGNDGFYLPGAINCSLYIDT
ncbi:MAG: DUF11 domain-containing protein, partial [Akkermansiaceae bacterium]|nr:DUF11 domain-containing protein [Akkermansiaceae bacterium]